MQDEPSLIAKVEEWLRKQGYPLEMKVAQALKRRGWFLLHSRRYKDPILEKEREIDLLALNETRTEHSVLDGDLVIECKWTRDKPWVLFSGTKLASTPVAQLVSIPKTSGALQKTSDIPFRRLPDLPIFEGIHEGYLLVQAFKNEDAVNAAYAAVQTVINAADFFASQMSGDQFNILFVPVVVIEGELLRGSLTETGEIVIDPIEFGVLSHLRATEAPRFVHIVRESSLDEFIIRAERTFAMLRALVLKKPRRKRSS